MTRKDERTNGKREDREEDTQREWKGVQTIAVYDGKKETKGRKGQD